MLKRKKHTNNNSIGSTLSEPKRHINIPENAKWLSGEGAGSWFLIKAYQDSFKITRFSPEGDIECQSIFKTNGTFDLNEEFEMTYLSHCKEVNVIQNNQKITFYRNELQ